MKRILLAGLLLTVSMGVTSGKGNKICELTKQEKTQLLNEADDFIDELPDGLQDRQADAVLHAMQGAAFELQEVRQSRDKSFTYSDNIKITDICPIDGMARGINMRLYQPKVNNDKLPLLIYLHGGGWTFGSLNSCAAFCDALTSSGNIAVLAVDYSLAPENPFPRGLSDCIAVVEYVFANTDKLGTSPTLISLGGDSSGGNLALATSIYMIGTQKSDKELKSLILYYPVVNINNENTGSWRQYSRGYGLDRRLMDAFSSAYDDNGRSPEQIGNISKDVLKSPLSAPEDILAKLPPILMIAAERDILADQGKAFTEKVKKTGNSIERIEFPGSVHLFITVPGQPTAFNKAVALTADFLNNF
ncbi:MAG: alpha/beta hydrolase [Bacteroides sp.]|nr:alpha/beta hydrolase [Bacteroides sp.]